jgi:ribonuclease HII
MLILGIDEVGRGSLAGPLVVGAVALDLEIKGLKDSKLLTKKRRENLANDIYLQAKYCGLGWASNQEIDSIGLTNSLKLAASRSVAKLSIKIDKIIIDGVINLLPDYDSQLLIKADNCIPAVSAASIIAKVARDNYMISLEEVFPEYGFKTNVGYGTKNHLLAINKFGPTKYHRISFNPLKSMISS